VAQSAEEAFQLLDNAGGIVPDLLLTDVVLPGQSGPQLAATLEERSPGLRVLFVSGYARDALGRAQILGENVQFLQKPFTLNALLRKIRTLLDQQVRS